MTVCFMILAHSRPQQFLELTRIIKNSGGETVAFIDKKANLQEFETADAHFVSRRFNGSSELSVGDRVLVGGCG